MRWEGRSLRWQIVNTNEPAGLAKVEECVKGFFVAALCNAALDFFNWNFFVIAQQRMIRRCDPSNPPCMGAAVLERATCQTAHETLRRTKPYP
jgi:hypothetical protein